MRRQIWKDNYVAYIYQKNWQPTKVGRTPFALWKVAGVLFHLDSTRVPLQNQWSEVKASFLKLGSLISIFQHPELASTGKTLLLLPIYRHTSQCEGMNMIRIRLNHSRCATRRRIWVNHPSWEQANLAPLVIWALVLCLFRGALAEFHLENCTSGGSSLVLSRANQSYIMVDCVYLMPCYSDALEMAISQVPIFYEHVQEYQTAFFKLERKLHVSTPVVSVNTFLIFICGLS